jgi:hypothetical protein
MPWVEVINKDTGEHINDIFLDDDIIFQMMLLSRYLNIDIEDVPSLLIKNAVEVLGIDAK